MNKKSFLLLEVILTVAILSVGLVFVIRAMATCMQVQKSTFYYRRAMDLAYGKLFELELISQNSGLSPVGSAGKFDNNEGFTWKYSVEKIEGKNLSRVVLETSWQDKHRIKSFSAGTYVRTRE
jgi:competence protein ComGC